jgi:hypothetical protein
LVVGCLLLCLCAATEVLAQAAGKASSPGPSFAYREDPDQLVLRYVERPSEIAGPDAEQSLSVYGDGRVVTRRPPFATRPGSWGGSLSRAEVQELLRSLLEDGIVEFDEEQVRQSRRDLKRQRRLQTGELHEVSDADTVTIEVFLERYRGTGPGARERRDVVKRVTWRSLRSDLRRYPELTELQRLGSAHAKLRAVMDRPDLSRLDSPGDR